MARPPINLAEKIKAMLGHVHDLPPESTSPLAHYNRSATDLWNLLQYVERNFDQLRLYPTVAERHLGRLNSMLLVHFIETFERYLKETAAVCVNVLAGMVLDDRFKEFHIQTSSFAAKFDAESLGRALCESMVWLDCQAINDRFRKLLANPYEAGSFQLFPQQPASEKVRHDTLAIVWQLRHAVVHNVGVITQTDAVKLRILAKAPIDAPRVLSPTRDDLRYLKRFLDETALYCNVRISDRMAVLLSAIHSDNPILFEPQPVANRISRSFGRRLTIAGIAGSIP